MSQQVKLLIKIIYQTASSAGRGSTFCLAIPNGPLASSRRSLISLSEYSPPRSPSSRPPQSSSVLSIQLAR